MDNHVSTIVLLHHMDFKETPGEKTKWEPHKDAGYCFEKVLEMVPYKAVSVRPLTTHLKLSK